MREELCLAGRRRSVNQDSFLFEFKPSQEWLSSERPAIEDQTSVKNQLDHKAEDMRGPPGVHHTPSGAQISNQSANPARQRTYPGMFVQTAASAGISPPRSPQSSVRPRAPACRASEIPAVFRWRVAFPLHLCTCCTVRAVAISGQAPAFQRPLGMRRGALGVADSNLHSYW